MKQLFFLLAIMTAVATAQAQTARHPFFQLDADAKQSLVNKAKTLKVGDSYETVVSRLGHPLQIKFLCGRKATKLLVAA